MGLSGDYINKILPTQEARDIYCVLINNKSPNILFWSSSVNLTLL